ncbi:MAG: NERD domain-containing protein [Coprobacillus sp.]|nr:NERD domain-containing protein [Coprobacillus sp.]
MSTALTITLSVIGGVIVLVAVIFLCISVFPRHKVKNLSKKVDDYINRLPIETKTIYKNILIPAKDNPVKFDYIVVTTKGVYAILVKDFSGVIEGNNDDPYWKQTTKDKNTKTYKVYNPVREIQGDVPALSKIISKEREYVHPVVVIGCESFDVKNPTAPVVKPSDLTEIIIKWENAMPTLFTHREYTRIVESLNFVRDNPPAIKEISTQNPDQ